MKKILLAILILSFTCQLSFADEVSDEDIENVFTDEPEQSTEIQGYLEYTESPDDAIYLDETAKESGLNISGPKSFNSKSLVSGSKKPTLQPIQDGLDVASKFSSQEYNIGPVSNVYDKKIGKVSFGTTYDSFLNSARVNYSTGIFAKYDGKHFAVTSTFAKRTNSNYDSYTDRIYVAPEWKLTKRLSLLDVMQSDVMQISKSNEIVLRYKPHFKNHAEDVQLELGAGQSFYEDNYINSSIRFSTRFRL